MSDFNACPRCGKYDFLGRHRCPPVWEWRCDNLHDVDEWREVHALDAEDAAEKAGEIYNEGDYTLTRNDGATVEIDVRDPRTGDQTRWEVNAEMVPRFHAFEISPPAPTTDSGQPETADGDKS